MEILQKYLLHKWQYFCFEKTCSCSQRKLWSWFSPPTNQVGSPFFDSSLLSCLVLILSWFFCLSRPIPRLVLKLNFKRDQDQDLSWNKISNETNTKTGLDLKILSRPRPILGLDSPSLEFRDQDQESCWKLVSAKISRFSSPFW